MTMQKKVKTHRKPPYDQALSLPLAVIRLVAKRPLICSTPGCNHGLLANLTDMVRELQQEPPHDTAG